MSLCDFNSYYICFWQHESHLVNYMYQYQFPALDIDNPPPAEPEAGRESDG